MYTCTPPRNFCQFEEIQIMGPNLPKKHEWQKLTHQKINIKIKISI